MRPEEIGAWALSRGWWLDKQGNLRKEWNDREYRLKLGDKKARYEVRVEGRWVRLSSAFYKDLSVSAEGKLTGMKKAI